MSQSLSSSNPFRRKAQPSAPSTASGAPAINHIAYQQVQAPADIPSIDPPKKTVKKVRVQSPPPLSPSIPDSPSTIVDDDDSIFNQASRSVQRDGDPFDATTSDTSEDEAINKRSTAPPNPFQKTLEIMEHRELQPAAPPASATVTSPGIAGKASMDVNAFKRLLMTGDSGLGTSTPPVAATAHLHHGLGDGSSSTDTSSLSRQSIFEPVQEPHPESPRTSHEISEPDDERRTIMEPSITTSNTNKRPPPPPSSKHGKLLKLELRDDPPPPPSTSISISIPMPQQQIPTPLSTTGRYVSRSPDSMLSRSQTDLNKPLPQPPTRLSHDSDRESIFDREALGKTPEPPSPSSSIRRKTPPAPPLTRRHSQLVSEPKPRTAQPFPSPRLASNPESELEKEDVPRERSISTVDFSSNGNRSRSNSDKSRAPPPPPTRRPASIRGGSLQPVNSSTVSLPTAPIPPPARGSSKSVSGRPPSVVSMDMGFDKGERKEKKAPPVVPRHRHGTLTGTDSESRRTSGELWRTSVELRRGSTEMRRSGEMRRGSAGSSLLEEQGGSIGGEAPGGAKDKDILADLTRLQREIDELRMKGGKV